MNKDLHLILDKKITRKQFVFSIASIVALFFVSKVPKILSSDISNKYGNNVYGGTKNA